MVRLAANGLVSFSDAPLRLALWGGAVVSALAILYGLLSSASGGSDPSLARGWSSTIVKVAGLGGAENMLMTGVIGLYVGRIPCGSEAPGPLGIVERAVGFEDPPASERRPARTSESASPRPGRGRARWS